MLHTGAWLQLWQSERPRAGELFARLTFFSGTLSSGGSGMRRLMKFE